MRLLLVIACCLLTNLGFAQEAPRFPGRFGREYEMPGFAEVRGLAFIPNSTRFAAVEAYSNFTLWDYRTGERLQLKTDVGFGVPVAATPDGKSLLTFSKTGDFIVLDSTTLEVLKMIELAPKGHTNQLAVSPDSKRALIVSSAKKVVLVDLEFGKIHSTWDAVSEYTNFVNFSKDGKHCLYGGQAHAGAGPVTLGARWDWEEKTSVFVWKFPVFGTAFGLWDLPDGRWAGIGGNPNKLRIWDSKTHAELKTYDLHGYKNARSADGSRLVVVGRKGMAEVFDLTRKEPFLGSFRTETDPETVALNAEGTELIIGTRQTSILQYELSFPRAGGEVAEANQPLGPLNAANDDGVRVIGPDAKGDSTLVGHSSSILHLVALPDSRHLLTTGFDQRMLLWDLQEHKVVRRVEGENGFDLVYSAAVSPDGKKLLVAGGQRRGQQGLSLWDATTLEKLRTYEGLTEVARNVAFSPDGARVAAAGQEVIVWETATGKEIAKFQAKDEKIGVSVQSLEFDATGKSLFYSHTNTLVRQSVEDKGDQLQAQLGQVQVIRRRPESNQIIADAGRALLFLNSKDLTETQRYEIPSPMHSISFSANGKRIAVTGASFSTVWNLAPEELVFSIQDSNRRFGKSCLTPDGTKLIVIEGNRLKVTKLSPLPK